MAQCSCVNGHRMWNGDGKPVVEAYRVEFLREYTLRHPGRKFNFDDDLFQIYYCTDDYPEEDLDCWYCDECHSLTVFIDSMHIRYDFERIKGTLDIVESEVSEWQKYIAMREEEFEKFQDYYEGKTPWEAVKHFDFDTHYRVSPGKDYIYGFDKNGRFVHGFKLVRKQNLK